MIILTDLTWSEDRKRYVTKGFSLKLSVDEMLTVSDGLKIVNIVGRTKGDRNRAESMFKEIHKEMERHSETA